MAWWHGSSRVNADINVEAGKQPLKIRDHEPEVEAAEGLMEMLLEEDVAANSKALGE